MRHTGIRNHELWDIVAILNGRHPDAIDNALDRVYSRLEALIRARIKAGSQCKLSDDGLHYRISEIISDGREAYERACKSPEKIKDLWHRGMR